MELVSGQPNVELRRGADGAPIVVLAFPYDAQIVAVVRTIPHRRFDWDRREWWAPVDDCPLPSSTLTWSLWSHTWRPAAAGRYQIVLRVDDQDPKTPRRIARAVSAARADGVLAMNATSGLAAVKGLA